MRRIEKTILLPVLVVFSAVMVVVIISFVMSRNDVDRELNDAASEYTNSTRMTIRDRLSIFEETLRAGVGLFAGNENVTEDQFSRFINTSAVLERYSGAQSVAYAKVVPASQVAGFTDTMRSSVKPDFTVYPAGNRDTYVPITYIEPKADTNKQIIGFDISSEATRLKALTAARDTGRVTITEVIQSPIDSSPDAKGFVMYAPQYKHGMPIDTVDQRRAAIQGYIFTGFRTAKFMENILPKEDDKNISFKITVGDNRTEFYVAPDYPELATKSPSEITSDLAIGNNTLHFTFAYDRKALMPNSDSRPIAILIFGFVAAALIAGAVWLILRGKANELLLEQERGINEAKDNLLSLASHQLRTPATGVKQYLGLILQGYAGKISKQQQQLLEKAYAGNERQLKTINDVLYLARLGSGRIILSKSTFSVEQLIRDIVRELHNEIEAKKHVVTIKAPKRSKDFYGDAHMIRMAIENLITNAVKYTRDGGKVTVHLQQNKTEMKVSVTDSGIGIDQSQQDRLFEQFERIDNDLSIAVGGSGIGLYVVRNIAGMHEGHVEVTSEIDHGSTFTIVLPYISAD